MKKNIDPWAIEEHSPKRPALFAKEELTFRIIDILDKGSDVAWALQQVCDAMIQHSTIENAVFVRISFHNNAYLSHPFEETLVVVKHDFQLPDKKKGLVELFLSHEAIALFPE